MLTLKPVAVALLLVAASAIFAQGATKATAEQMLQEIKAVQDPPWDSSKGADDAYREQYYQAWDDKAKERGQLILALYEAYPDNPEVPALMATRWVQMRGPRFPATKERLQATIKDIDSVLLKKPGPEITRVARFSKAQTLQMASLNDATKLATIADGYIAQYPKDPKGVNLLLAAAETATDDATKVKLYQRMADGYPDHPLTPMFRGTVKRLASVGKPFDISFTDAIGGGKVDSASLKGKVVLVDFWATWCGPCLASMPDLKKLYAAYKDKGLEIVGVSLDQPEANGGLQRLKDYVSQNGIGWPQYYQGKGWDGEFSTSWGIMAIPAAFLVDKKGVLRYIDTGADLEKKIQALLAE